MEDLKSVLMTRDGLSLEDAQACINDARETLNECLMDGNMDDAMDICMSEFGLEPDYLMDLIG